MRLEMFDVNKHYETVCSWWKQHKWDVVPTGLLPKHGIVIYDGDTPAAAGWVYSTDSKICWIEWIVVNPTLKRNIRGAAIEELIEALQALAKELGFLVAFTSVRVPRLIKRLELKGFVASESGMTNLTRVLWHQGS